LRKDDPRVGYLLMNNIPMSLLGHSTDHPEVPSVETDHGEGCAMAIRHLVSLGRCRLGHINVPTYYNYGRERSERFAQTCRDLGLEMSDQVEMIGDLSEVGGYQATMSLLERSPRPDAIITGNDAMAIGALHAIVQSGLTPGRDISLVGSDDIPVSSLVNPPLTTLRAPFRAHGAQVARHLLLAMDGKDDGTLRLVEPPTLIVRAT
jgi:LacI family transcriptional regulator